MKRLALKSNSLFNQPAHKPFSQNQCCLCNGRERPLHPAAHNHTLCDVFRQPRRCIFPRPLSTPRRQHALFYHPDAVCIHTALAVKLQVIKWETVASSRSSKWQRENVPLECKFNSRHTVDVVLGFRACNFQFWKTFSNTGGAIKEPIIHFQHWFKCELEDRFLTTTTMFQALLDSKLFQDLVTPFTTHTVQRYKYFNDTRNLVRQQIVLQN